MFADVNGIELYYEVCGAGAPIVLLHGNGEDHTVFRPLVQLLSPRYTVYTIDSRDHGQSTQTGRLSYDAMADDAIAFIRAMGLNRPALLGSSDGGITGILAAIKEPALLSALIPCGANTEPEGLKPWFTRFLRFANRCRPDAKLALMLNEPHIPPEALRRIVTPTMLLAGSRDLIAESHTRAIAAAIPNAALHILPHETHTSYLTRRPEVCMTYLVPFLEQHPAG